MGKNNFLGGFIGTTSNLITPDVPIGISGKYNVDEIIKMKAVGSTQGFVGVGTYLDSTMASSGYIPFPSAINHVFVSVAGGAGSGAHDVDCQGQGPGGAGGAGKALVAVANVGYVTSIVYTLGAGGPGIFGNDAFGSDGGLSRITIGNFSITANGGQGGRSKNGGSNAGAAGNVTFSGPSVLTSTSSVFARDVVIRGEGQTVSSYEYTIMPTSSTGTPGACGNTGSLPGTSGFIYIRYGAGINGSTSLTPGLDPAGVGNTQAYTPNYS